MGAPFGFSGVVFAYFSCGFPQIGKHVWGNGVRPLFRISVDSPSPPPHLLPMPERKWKRKYRWVQTWPEEKEDWSAFHDGLYIGRVSRDRTSLKKGMFLWSGGCSEWPGFQGPMPHNGRKAEAWEAAKAVEDWYDEGLARSGVRPAMVAQRIGPVDEGGLPLWLRG